MFFPRILNTIFLILPRALAGQTAYLKRLGVSGLLENSTITIALLEIPKPPPYRRKSCLAPNCRTQNRHQPLVPALARLIAT